MIRAVVVFDRYDVTTGRLLHAQQISLLDCGTWRTVIEYELTTNIALYGARFLARLRARAERERQVINAIDASRVDENRFATVADDGTLKIWYAR
jgi:hypothetical protein